MNRRWDTEKFFLLSVDAISIATATALTWWLRYRSGLFSEPEPFSLPLAVYALLTLFWITIFALRGQYRRLYHFSRFQSLQQVGASVLVGLMLLFVITIDPRQPLGPGRLLLLGYGGVVFLGAGLGRVLFRTVQKRLLERGVGLRPTLIVGDGDTGRELHRQFLRHPGMGYRVLGRLSAPSDTLATSDGPDTARGALAELPLLLGELGITEVVVTSLGREVLFQVISDCVQAGVEVQIVPDLYDLVLGSHKATDLWGLPMIQVFPHLMAPWQFLLKRLLDLGVSSVMLLLGLPLFLLWPLVLARVSPHGPVIHRQRRTGKGDRDFTLYKFRTMVDQPDSAIAPLTAADDPRVLGPGRWLRRYRLDEWPQFLNILLGQMSLVGPRPERREFVEDYIRRWPLYARRHNVRPGLTGWAQVKQHYDQSVRALDDKLLLDLFYLENMSLALDLKILLFTVRTVLRGSGR
ncbi:MAG: exopolysaccharide biosynthesis polyprenyl glycosylphosphotransferase [Candidatus Cloacimonetes bacterium]|nr:exopolysaccharide biosynthesis polyprenyl glycosylphosphotransferase [Candidatus Cloacimonadota bacterium]